MGGDRSDVKRGYLPVGMVVNLVYVVAAASGALAGRLIMPVTLALVGLNIALVIARSRPRKASG
jgi:hypothetical protein